MILNIFSKVDFNPCWNLPCKNSGSCERTSSGYKCNCVNGYFGAKCLLKTSDSTIFVNSSILTQSQSVDLLNLINFPLNTSWSLIYQATRDGFRAFDFHSKCDNKSNTLTIIKSDIGQVFGGFTTNIWFNPSLGFRSDANSFLFSLINSEKYPAKMKSITTFKAIVYDSTRGPVFGAGNDISISDNSNQNYKSFAKFKYSYLKPDYNKYGKLTPNSVVYYLFDLTSFRTAQIEVYSLNGFYYSN